MRFLSLVLLHNLKRIGEEGEGAKQMERWSKVDHETFIFFVFFMQIALFFSIEYRNWNSYDVTRPTQIHLTIEKSELSRLLLIFFFFCNEIAYTAFVILYRFEPLQ